MPSSRSSVVSEQEVVEEVNSLEPGTCNPTICLFCQLRRDKARPQIEIYCFANEDDNENGPWDCTSRCASRSIRKSRKTSRRRNKEQDEEEDEEGKVKTKANEAKIVAAPTVSSEPFGNGTVEVRLLGRYSRDDITDEEHECLELPVAGYMMDFGLISGFLKLK